MTILVGYASGSGCTAEVAGWIAGELGSAGRAAESVDLATAPDPGGYDAVVVGSGVRAGSWHGSAQRWLKDHADSLRERPLAVYSVCLNVLGDPKDPAKPVKWDEVEAYAAKPVAAAGLTPLSTRAFAGWYDPAKFAFAERMIMKVIKAPTGDFRDEAEVRAWARELAATL